MIDGIVVKRRMRFLGLSQKIIIAFLTRKRSLCGSMVVNKKSPTQGLEPMVKKVFERIVCPAIYGPTR